MAKLSLYELLKAKKYPGRGIVIGKTDAGKEAVVAYFIMGRSENSRNRVFKEEGEGIKTEAYDESKLTDPSLIIYSPVKIIDNKLIVSNGDQTDTIYEGLKSGLGLESSLKKEVLNLMHRTILQGYQVLWNLITKVFPMHFPY